MHIAAAVTDQGLATQEFQHYSLDSQDEARHKINDESDKDDQ